MKPEEFRHEILIPLEQIEKSIIHRLSDVPEKEDLERLFEILNRKLSQTYERLS